MVRGPLCDVGIPVLSPNNFTEAHIIKTEWLAANMPSLRSPDRAKRDIFVMMLHTYLDIFCQSSPFLWFGSHSVFLWLGGQFVM